MPERISSAVRRFSQTGHVDSKIELMFSLDICLRSPSFQLIDVSQYNNMLLFNSLLNYAVTQAYTIIFNFVIHVLSI